MAAASRAAASALINSAQRNAGKSRCASGPATVTKPLPQRSAASPASSAAPNMPLSPPTTNTRPASPLCASIARGGNFGGAMRRAAGGTALRASTGMRKSSNTISPARARPRPVSKPSFTPMKVTVMSAATHGSNAAPVSLCKPDGMSSASTAPGAFSMRRIKSAATPCGARLKPVPNSASMIKSAPSSAAQSFVFLIAMMSPPASR